MGKKDKLEEAKSLMAYFDYQEDSKGKTSGSRVVFRKDATSAKFALHKPHPQKELKEYQAKGLLEHLEQEGLI